MSKCVYRINVDGHQEEFNSEEELHSFLRENRKLLKTSLITDQIVFSKERSKQDTADDMVKTMSDTVQFDKAAHELKVGDTIYEPVTKYIASQKLIPEFRMDEWRNNTIQNLLKQINLDGTQKYNVAEADEIVKKLKGNWETQTMIGTSFHDIAEGFFNGTIVTPEDILKQFPELQGRDYILKKYITDLQNFKNQLIKKHGDDAIFRPEVKIYDKEKGVAGVSDLLVIDKDGKVHIYDYKTSVKDEGKWSQAKELTIQYQLGIYKQLLLRNGLDVDTVNYIPVELNDVDYDKKVINDFKINPTKSLYLSTGDKVSLNIDRLLPYDFSIKLQDATSNKDVYTFLKEAFNYESARDTAPAPLSLDEEFEKLKARTPKDAKYYVIYSPIDKNANQYIPINTPEEKVRARLESSMKHFADYQRHLPIRFYDFVTYAKGQVDKGEPIDWESRWAKDSGTVNKMITLLSKYITDPDWKPLKSDALYDLNTVAFENSKTNQVDFMTLSGNDLSKAPTLLRGKTLLGNFLTDSKAKFNKIPDSVTNGDVELMKLVAFIKANKDIFEQKKIGQLYAMNIFKNNKVPRVYTQTLDALSKQWDVLIQNIPSTIDIKNKDWSIQGVNYLDAFVQDITAMFDKPLFQSTLGIKQIANDFTNLSSATEKQEKVELLNRISDTLLKGIGYDPHTGVFRQPDASRLIYLASQAILQLEDRPTLREADMKNYANLLKENINTSNPTSIRNQAYQNVVALTSKALNNTTHKFNEYKERVKQITSDLYKAHGNIASVKIIGYNLPVFENLFERDADGKKTMRFKDPDSSPKLSDAERKYIREYTNILGEVRAMKLGLDGDTEPLGKEYKLNIPLMRASELTAFAGQNYKEWFKNYFRDITNPQNIYENDVDSKELLASQSKMFNFFDRYDIDLEARQDKLDHSDFTEFESDLESVLDMYFMIHSKESEMNKIMPAINAQKMVTMFSEHYMFEDNATTAKGLNDYIGTVLFDKNLIAEESKNLAVGAQFAKKIVSYASIGFSPISGITEFFTGWGNNITRTLANRFDSSAFGGKELSAAAALVFGDLNTNKMSFENVSFGDNVNEMFRISDMNLKELVHKVQTTSSGLSKFNSHWAFWFQSFPSYTNRMTMFLAQMIHDGAIKTDSFGRLAKDSAMQMIDGKLVYNDKLDTRFQLYLSDVNKAEHLQSKDWKESRAAYLKMQEQLGQEPGGLKADGSLARPYDNQTRDSMKQMADDVHGNYDKETKTRLEQLAFGKIFLQFKTYLTAKKNRWYMDTHVNDRTGRWETEWHNDTPIKVWHGRVTEGIWQTLCALTNETVSNRGNVIKSWEGLHSSQKQNIALMVGDILQFGLYSLMLGLAGYAALKKEDPLQAELLRGLNNASQDLWIGNSVSALAGAKNPIAVLSWSTGVLNNSWGVLTGRDNAGTDLLNNVAIFRTLDKMTK